jgi:hypothetical protein
MNRTHNIDDENEVLLHCFKDIQLKLRNIGPVIESNKAICCKYILVIFHASINIIRELTGKKISLNPQFKIIVRKIGVMSLMWITQSKHLRN